MKQTSKCNHAEPDTDEDVRPEDEELATIIEMQVESFTHQEIINNYSILN